MSAEQVHSSSSPSAEDAEVVDLPAAEADASVASETTEGLDIDSILDEIDGVLEANAEVFAQQYQQRGGQ